MITLAIDNFEEGTGRPIPNGITREHYREGGWDTSSPYLDYPRIFYYAKESSIDIDIYHTPNAPNGAWYPMNIGWFDFTFDYFKLINPKAFKKGFKIVFFYHEADNPKMISRRITELCKQYDYHNVAVVSGNSAATDYKYTHYWPELEYMYRRSVDFTTVPKTHFKRRSKHFTALVRIDKLWRKVFMSNLWAKGLHKNGYFSYCQEQLGEQDDYDGLPLYNEWLAEQQPRVNDFIQAGPFFVDELSSDERNNYAVTPIELYEDSYFNIVLETFIDVDSSEGQFITEKTLKPILHCQPFICVAEHQHLKHLRELGYATFGHIWDESYDEIEDTNERFRAVMKLSEELARMPLDKLHDMYLEAEPTLLHNRSVLESDLSHRLGTLIDTIRN